MLRLDELPRGLIKDQMRRLLSAFAGGNQPEPDAFADELRIATRGWVEAEFVSAVTTCIREERYFPRIAAIVRHRPERKRQEDVAESAMNHCSRCRAHFFYAGFELPSGIVVPKLRCECPHNERAWHTDAARAWEETDNKLVAAGYVRQRMAA